MATTVISIIQVLVGAVLIIFVLVSPQRHSGLSMISGATDSFLSKNKARTADAKLAKWTKWVALVSLMLALVLEFPVNSTQSKCPSIPEGILHIFP